MKNEEWVWRAASTDLREKLLFLQSTYQGKDHSSIACVGYLA